jgi:hypothetical protein
VDHRTNACMKCWENEHIISISGHRHVTAVLGNAQSGMYDHLGLKKSMLTLQS